MIVESIDNRSNQSRYHFAPLNNQWSDSVIVNTFEHLSNIFNGFFDRFEDWSNILQHCIECFCKFRSILRDNRLESLHQVTTKFRSDFFDINV